MRTHLAERLTWRYVDAHAHQDEWSDTVQGYFHILSVSQPVYPPHSYGDTWCQYLRVKVYPHHFMFEVSYQKIEDNRFWMPSGTVWCKYHEIPKR